MTTVYYNFEYEPSLLDRLAAVVQLFAMAVALLEDEEDVAEANYRLSILDALCAGVAEVLGVPQERRAWPDAMMLAARSLRADIEAERGRRIAAERERDEVREKLAALRSHFNALVG